MLYPPAGTYDDILSILAREDEKRVQGTLPSKPEAARRFVDPALQLAAKLLLAGAYCAPAERMLAVQDRVYRALSAGPAAAHDEDSPQLARAAELARSVREASGVEPALLCPFSHPPVTGELVNFNLELIRSALKGLRAVRARPCRPSLVIAVDRFALDTLPLYQEGLYAGFMGLYHLGSDRLANSRPWPERLFLKGAAWPSLAGRIARLLGGGGEMFMALSGGVPTTGRLLYCAREFLGRLRRTRDRSVSPAEVRARLRAAAPAFARFENAGEVGTAFRRSAWRMLEAWAVHELISDGGLGEIDRGSLPRRGRDALTACARALGAETEAISKLEEEFARETPYRERFFRFLAARVVSRGRPIVLLPLAHVREGKIGIAFGEPTALLGAVRGAGGWRVRTAAPGGAPAAEASIGEFSRAFVRSRYD